MSVKLISKNERYPSNQENDKKPKDPIELPYVTAYDVTVSTPKTSLAKTYETKNEIKITLEIPKSDYKNESFQKLIKWAELPVQDENYYRDIAVNLKMAGDNERTVLFTHGRITLDIHNTTKADFVTVKVFVKQKEDQYVGVVFGYELGETYKEARKRVENPPTLNVFIPLEIKKEDNKDIITKEYAIKTWWSTNPDTPDVVEFHQRQITVNKRIFVTEFYLGDPSHFCIDRTNSASAQKWADAQAYGTNASFFGGGVMSALHIYNNENMGDRGGNIYIEMAGRPETAMDFMYYNGSSVGLKKRCGYWDKKENSGITNIVWGIGGFNLLLDDADANSNENFETQLRNYYPNLAYGQCLQEVSRTLIGYRKNDGKIVLVTAFRPDGSEYYGPTMYEAKLMMNQLGCTKALCLDGSTCTKISYKNSDHVNDFHDNDSGRNPWCRIRLKVDSAKNANWDCK